MSSIRTNRARCALYKKILDLLDEESVSGESSIELVSKLTRSPTVRECESNAKVQFKIVLTTNIYKFNIHTVFARLDAAPRIVAALE